MHSSKGHATLNEYGRRDFERTSLPPAARHGCLVIKARYKREPPGVGHGLHYRLSLLSELSLVFSIYLHILLEYYWLWHWKLSRLWQGPSPLGTLFDFASPWDQRPRLLRAQPIDVRNMMLTIRMSLKVRLKILATSTCCLACIGDFRI